MKYTPAKSTNHIYIKSTKSKIFIPDEYFKIRDYIPEFKVVFNINNIRDKLFKIFLNCVYKPSEGVDVNCRTIELFLRYANCSRKFIIYSHDNSYNKIMIVESSDNSSLETKSKLLRILSYLLFPYQTHLEWHDEGGVYLKESLFVNSACHYPEFHKQFFDELTESIKPIMSRYRSSESVRFYGRTVTLDIVYNSFKDTYNLLRDEYNLRK